MDLAQLKKQYSEYAESKSSPSYKYGSHAADVFEFLEQSNICFHEPIESTNEECDCEDFENGLVSNYCPIHNQ